MTRPGRRAIACAAACLLGLAAVSASAQPVLQTPREEFELRQPKLGEEPPPELVLPPIPPPPTRAPEGAGQRVLVNSFRFEGTTVFSDAELAAVVAPWTVLPSAPRTAAMRAASPDASASARRARSSAGASPFARAASASAARRAAASSYWPRRSATPASV